MIKKTISRGSQGHDETPKSYPGPGQILVFSTALSTPLQSSLFEIAPDSKVADLIDFASGLVDFDPEILQSIQNDFETHALSKKQKRLDEKRWQDAQTRTLIDGPWNESRPLKLGIGRPRTNTLCTLVFLFLRGWFGKGYKESHLRALILESLSLRTFLENMGQALPSASSLEENLNTISNETRQKIHRAELALALGEGLDDFKTIRGDSTAVSSASAYPTDSGTIAKLLLRMCSRLGKLEKLGLKPRKPSGFEEWITELKCLKFRIGTLTSSSAKQAEEAAEREVRRVGKLIDNQRDIGKKESAKQKLQRKLYERLYALGEEILPKLEKQWINTVKDIKDQPCSPAERSHREQWGREFEADLQAAKLGIDQSRRRVCEGKKPSAAGKMPLSISDPNASIIMKGGWERTFGYRPQLSFSKSNLVTALIVPDGNAADQAQFIPLVKATIENTGVVPKIMSADDGYTGAEQLEQCLKLGVPIVSFSGARGKALIGEEKWNSETYQDARSARNGAESGIGVLKSVEKFGELSAFGIEGVRGEMLEKVLSYNALKIISLRKRRYQKEQKKRWSEGQSGKMRKIA